MDRQHLTDDLIRALPFAPDTHSRYEISDASVENLRIRIGSKRKSFVLEARFGGSESSSRRRLGVFPDLTTEAARVAAHGWNKQVKGGVDPAIGAAEAEKAESLRLRSTFASVMEDYLAYIPTRERSLNASQDTAFIRRNILNPATNGWMGKPISEITDAEVAALVKSIHDRPARTQAFHCFRHLKTFFGWAMHPDRRWQIGLDRNPVEYLKAKQLGLRIKDRTRVLEYEETRAYLLACSATPQPYGPCLRVLVETGQRRGAVSRMKWSHINFVRKLWTIPGNTSKIEDAHLMPLSDRVIGLLHSLRDAQPEGHGDYVFSTTNGQKPIDNFSDLKLSKSDAPSLNGADVAKGRFERLMLESLETLAPGAVREPWVWHDVRRTVRTHLEPISGRAEVAETAIGHSRDGIVRVYNLYKYRAEIRRAFNQWSELLAKVERGTCTIADWEHDEEALENGSAP